MFICIYNSYFMLINYISLYSSRTKCMIGLKELYYQISFATLSLLSSQDYTNVELLPVDLISFYFILFFSVR